MQQIKTKQGLLSIHPKPNSPDMYILHDFDWNGEVRDVHYSAGKKCKKCGELLKPSNWVLLKQQSKKGKWYKTRSYCAKHWSEYVNNEQKQKRKEARQKENDVKRRLYMLKVLKDETLTQEQLFHIFCYTQIMRKEYWFDRWIFHPIYKFFGLFGFKRGGKFDKTKDL